MQNLADTGAIDHVVDKRFIDEDGASLYPYDQFDTIDPEEYLAYLESKTEPMAGGQFYDDDQFDNLDKRHGSRWNIIHQKLASLNEKRMDSRWRIIQNKLNQLNGIAKREDEMTEHLEENKRNMGRWKNRNWMMKQYTNHE